MLHIVFNTAHHRKKIANEKIKTFAKDNGILKTKPNFYGFNNPDPYRSPKKPEYGYECWVTVGDNINGNKEIKIKETEPGDYIAMYGVNMDEAWGLDVE